jgi:D-alanyl-lipoteichoic acid acyltransferase DltB (MBOAT superfamily)
MDLFSARLRDIFLYDSSSPILFNSGTFFILFLFFITVYALIHKNRLVVSLFVIVFGFFFYYKSSGLYVILLGITAITDFSLALAIDKAKKKSYKKLYLIIAVSFSLTILAFFKYTNFLLENLTDLVKFLGNYPAVIHFIKSLDSSAVKSFDEIMKNNFQPTDIFLPIGVSFFTFQSISYVIEVYRDKLPPTRNFINYVFYITFFPQLVAGPIVKAKLFLPQLAEKISIHKAEIWAGLWLIMTGLFKKAVIADYISQYNDFVFSAPHTYTGYENLMAILGYTLQIYCDFSGYSDMAIGLGKIMGFDLGINFNFPYKSLNITDFWRRWHISLSTWLRDYLYISLGGNRKGKWKMYRNLFLTMFFGGLWHGANWKFVIWGSSHGFALAIHKGFKSVLDKIPNIFPVRFLSWFLTFTFVIILWIFFRATDIPENSSTFTVKNGSGYTYKSATVSQTDSAKTVMVYFFDGNTKKDSVTQTVAYARADKVRVKSKITDNGDLEVTVSTMINAYRVALIMMKKVVTETSIDYIIPFWTAHTTWVILMLIGFLMHANPTLWTEKIKEIYIKSPYIVKLITFVIVVQLVIQFKSATVQPFIYFQF